MFDIDEKMKGIRIDVADYRRPDPLTAPSHSKAAGLYMICTISKHRAERRGYADAMLATVEAWVPATYAAFRDYRMGAVTFSAGMLAVLKRRLAGEPVDQAGSGLSKREWAELEAALG